MPNGTLTYDQMVEIINSGESVILDGQIVSQLEKLPLPEQMSQSKADQDAIRAGLEAQMAELQARLATMSPPVPTSDPTDVLPADAINPADGYVANHKALIALAKSKGYGGKGPNPSRATLVAFLNDLAK